MQMKNIIRIGTRESQLAVWQASQVKELLTRNGYTAELVEIKSEGDIDLNTPLYEMGVQGIFTRSLDAALVNKKIDVAVHSMKDVPTQLPAGISQAAVLKRGPVHDLLVFKDSTDFLDDKDYIANIATSSLRRKAQWLNKYPRHRIHNLRGNVNTRLKKLNDENWDAAIFAQAGLERIDLRPENSRIIDWMIPAPAQGAIIVVCRSGDEFISEACQSFNDAGTALCTRIERDFLRELLGGCSTPISALETITNNLLHFRCSILSLDGSLKLEIEKNNIPLQMAKDFGKMAARELLSTGGSEIMEEIRHATR